SVRLSGLRGRLCFSGFSSEIQPLPSERAGPELQSSRSLRREAAVCWTGGSTLETGHSQAAARWRAEDQSRSEEVFLWTHPGLYTVNRYLRLSEDNRTVTCVRGRSSPYPVTRGRREEPYPVTRETTSCPGGDHFLSWGRPLPVLGGDHFLSWGRPLPVLGETTFLSWRGETTSCPGGNHFLSWGRPLPVLGETTSCPGQRVKDCDRHQVQ
ncbi:hypothetical protein KUCAC02_032499, partial [Chaenocephalus aceratus]